MSVSNLPREGQHPEPHGADQVLRHALHEHVEIALAFSGAEDVALVDMALRIRPDTPVFVLDTGRLPPETYDFMGRVERHFGIRLEVLFPDRDAVEALVAREGLFGFYEHGHAGCCAVRKVAPLRRKLATVDAWITGQRRDQSPGTRQQVPTHELDTALGTPGQALHKYNPLAGWSSERVWAYIRERGLPYNALHERGFVSIGCAPCTRPVLPGQHEREGRWWWETQEAKECGLHAGNLRRAAND